MLQFKFDCEQVNFDLTYPVGWLSILFLSNP